jgi:CPA1 family monovalent cation:H+ antiporter
VYPAALLPRLLPAIREREARPTFGGVFVVGWAGLRGAVTLAASLSIPLAIPSAGSGETPFPARDLIIFMASSVIVFTLVVQGLTLPWFIRAFGLREGGVAEREERMARATAARAALARLEKYQQSDRAQLEQRIAARLAVDYMRRLETVRAHGLEHTEGYGETERRIRRDTIAAERTAIAGLRDTGAIGDEAFWTLQRELDHLEATMVEASEAQ